MVLDKLRLKTRKEEGRALAAKGGVDDSFIILPPSASKGGVSEKMIKVVCHYLFLIQSSSVKICEECKEEFCSGTCIIFQYDSYQVSNRDYGIGLH